MYDIIKLTIRSGNFKLSELSHRIKKLYAMGEFDDVQLNELLTLAVENADPEAERPEVPAMLRTLASQITALRGRLDKLESGANNVSGINGDGTDGYPVWEPWDGLSNKYQPGAIVSHIGQIWESVYSGQNVWEPGVVDQRFWVKFTPEA